MYEDVRLYVAVTNIANQLDELYSILPTPSFIAIRGILDNEFYVCKVYRNGQITYDKI